MKFWPEDNDLDGISDHWEISNGGTVCLDGCNDWDWDKETETESSRFGGDGISKLREYQGAYVGSTHMRLTPDKREVFVDYDENPHGAWAINQVEQQLGIDVIAVDGLDDPHGEPVVVGDYPLRWGATFPDDEAYHFILVDSVLYGSVGLDADPPPNMNEKRENHRYRGVKVQDGIYQWHDLSIYGETCQADANCHWWTNLNSPPEEKVHGFVFGVTWRDKLTNLRFWRSTAFLGVIDNIWSEGNSLPGDASSTDLAYQSTHVFDHEEELEDGRPARHAYFPVSASSDPVNPFPLLSAGESVEDNDPDPDRVLGVTKTEMARRVTLHELGHALGMWTEGAKPHPVEEDGPSVMRVGIGPGMNDEFSDKDKQQVRLGK